MRLTGGIKLIAAVVPVKNEARRVGLLLERLQQIEEIGRIYVILNGSDSQTVSEVYAATSRDFELFRIVTFPEPLGIDVPRAVGAFLAHRDNSDYVLFVDGDLVGDISGTLKTMIKNTVENRLDLALMDCYPGRGVKCHPGETMLLQRLSLNKKLGLAEKLGLASPSHGPHLVSARLLGAVPWEDFAVPPKLLVHAVLNNMNIGIAGITPHFMLGSSIKSQTHSQMVTETIIGDCLEAQALIEKKTPVREANGKIFLGYHTQRRFDLLKQFIEKYREH